MKDGTTLDQGVVPDTFREATVEADGFDIRFLEAGTGEPLVCLHGAGGLRLSRTHEILAQSRRVIAFEIPGFGASPVNDRSETLEDLARTMNTAVAALGVDGFSVLGNSFGAKLSLWMTSLERERVAAAVLIAPAVIRPENDGAADPPSGSMRDVLYAHPENHPESAPVSPDIEKKQQALVARLIGPSRDAVLESRVADLDVPVLALFGTEDRMIPPELAHLYREAMQNCHLVMVYDAAHAIDADRPEAVASVVDDFLDRHEMFLVRQKSGLIHP